MLYDKSKLMENYEIGRDGRTPAQFIRETVNSLLQVWIDSDFGKGLFRLSGGYWEVLLPLMQKYAPEKLEEYGKLIGEDFTETNETVKKVFDYGSDLLNILGVLAYISDRVGGYSTPSDYHTIDLGDDEIIYYIPNSNTDQKDVLGRE